MKEPLAWTEALEDLLTATGGGSAAERVYRTVGRLEGVRALAVWTRVHGAGWLRTKSRGPESLLPPTSVVEAFLEGRKLYTLPPGRHIMTLPGGRDALVVMLDLGFDPDLLEALVLVLAGASSSSPRAMLDALNTLLAEDVHAAGRELPEDTARGLAELFRLRPEEDSDPASGRQR